MMQMRRDNDLNSVDPRVTDLRGKWQHTARRVAILEPHMCTDGFTFDRSSIAGWKAINESNMIEWVHSGDGSVPSKARR